MESLSVGQWVQVQNGTLQGLVGQVLNRRSVGRVLLVVRTLVPKNGVSLFIDESNVKPIPAPPLEQFEIRPAVECWKDFGLTEYEYDALGNFGPI